MHGLAAALVTPSLTGQVDGPARQHFHGLGGQRLIRPAAHMAPVAGCDEQAHHSGAQPTRVIGEAKACMSPAGVSRSGSAA
jgi:hypothetical protein